MSLADSIECIEEADMRRNEFWCTSDVAQPLTKFTQHRTVFDLNEDSAEWRDHRAGHCRFRHLQRQKTALSDVRCDGIEHDCVVRHAAHRQMRAKGDGLLLRSQALAACWPQRSADIWCLAPIPQRLQCSNGSIAGHCSSHSLSPRNACARSWPRTAC